MASYRIVLHTKLPVATVFTYMAMFSNALEWNPLVTDAHALAPGDVRLGSEFEVLAEVRGSVVPFVFSIVEFDPPTRVVLESVTNTFYLRDVITVYPLDDGVCELTYFPTARFRGFAALFNLALAVPFRRNGQRERVRIAQALGRL